MSSAPAYVPPLGDERLTPLYDAAIALFTREGRWRRALIEQIAPRKTDVILDIGCGTGTLACLIANAAPGATIIGVDPDTEALNRARAKAQAEGAQVEFIQGMGRHAAQLSAHWAPNKVVSSLVLHQMSLAEKRQTLIAARAALSSGGQLHVADYGQQRTPLMRQLFRTVQSLDGFENTEPNAQGVLPRLIREAGFEAVEETATLPTPTGSISLYRARAI